jgi:signal transduction histidine kinase
MPATTQTLCRRLACRKRLITNAISSRADWLGLRLGHIPHQNWDNGPAEATKRGAALVKSQNPISLQSPMPSLSPATPLARFNLTRWFALAALVTITLLAVATGTLLNRFITQRLLWQQAVLTSEFVQSLVIADKSLQSYFEDPSSRLDAETELALKHIAALPDMLRANVYDRSRRMIWSSDRQLIGRSFGPNDELDRALTGLVVTAIDDEDDEQTTAKSEHTGLQHPQSMFVEIYVPVLSQASGKVLAVVEFYKNPRPLMAALSELRTYIVLGAAASGVLLFLALYGLVRRGHLIIRSQQRQLVNNETLAVIGEMSAAVAHGIRNPLASIRSSAELIQGGDLAQAHSASADIVAQSDRLENWVRELLAYARPLEQAVTAVPLQPLVARCLDALGRDLEQRRISSRTEFAAGLPAVRGNPLLLGQVLASVLANAVEALERDGQITVRGVWAEGQSLVTLSVEDSGPGMTPAQLARSGKPFHTTKPRGLGMGLALARRVMERYGGRLEIDSTPGRGTTVRLQLQPA